MARIAGRNGALYVNLTSGGTAEPMSYLSSWSLDFSTNQVEVTAMGDTNTVNVSGLPAATGTYSGFWDNASAGLYSAAVDGVARKFYLYPDRSTNGTYWFGTANFDFSVSADVGGAVAISGSLSAASGTRMVGP